MRRVRASSNMYVVAVFIHFFGDAREPSIMTLPFEINNEIARACVYWIYIKMRLVKGEEDKWKRNVALVMDDDMTQ